jgi:hypothetical protein
MDHFFVSLPRERARLLSKSLFGILLSRPSCLSQAGSDLNEKGL